MIPLRKQSDAPRVETTPSLDERPTNTDSPQGTQVDSQFNVYTESGQWNVEYRVENEKGITAYKTLGSVSSTNSVLPFPSEAMGWRCGLRISNVSPNGTSVFNGFIFEDTEVVQRP